MKRYSLVLILLSFFHLLIYQVTAQTSTPLKTAVLIVGNDAQNHAVGHLNSLATIFQQNGVKVFKYYYPNAHWSDIKAKAASCSFFVYTGHGVSNGGWDGFGGLYVNEFVTSQQIIEDIKFQNKPLIIYLNACGSHGSSAGDPNDIGTKEATKRVCDTALPYFMAGAGGYFATSGFITGFLEDFLKGKALNVCFKEYVEDWEDIYVNQAIGTKNALYLKYLGISGFTIDDKTNARRYGTAFIGPTNFTVQSIQQKSK